MAFEQVFADLGGIPANRLSDAQALAGMLLAAANAAGLNPAHAPVVKTGPKGVAASLLCHGGHVALHALPEEGLCYVDVAGLGTVHTQRAIDVVVKRLGARDVHTESRRRGGGPTTTRTTNQEAS